MSHLPDPVLTEASEGHYQKFSDGFGTETTEIHLPSAKFKEQKNTMVFTALNTNLTIICTEHDKPRLVYAHKKPHILRKFKQITSELLFTCGTTVPELTGNKDLLQLYIRGNLTCLMSVEKSYHSAGYDACCCHCGSKRKLTANVNCYPICSLCKF